MNDKELKDEEKFARNQVEDFEYYSWKYKQFKINFEKLIALSNCNKIHIVTSRDFKTIDVLSGHTLNILALDVSEFTADVVSYSQNHLILHKL